MCKFLPVVSLVLLASCSPPKYSYYFDSPSTHQNDNSTFDTVSIFKRNNFPTASRELVFFERRVAIDTGIISNDSIPPKKSNLQPNPQTTKEEKKRMYLEKKRTYMEARKAYAATKNKRLDGFAIAGAVFFTAAFLCMFYPGAAIVFGILGIVASILGLKSRIWGLSVAALIASGVILTLYIFLNIMLSGSE